MKKGDIRDIQLATLVAEELGLILCSAQDWRLSELEVTRVDPVRGGKQFIVYVTPSNTSETFSSNDEMISTLERAQGYLRSSLASVLNLKRAPELKFVIDPFFIIDMCRITDE